MSSREIHAPGTEPALSLEQVLAVLRHRWRLIALCCVLSAASAFAFSQQQTRRYTAAASLVFNNAQLSQQVAGLQAGNNGDPQMQQGTNVKLVTLGGTAAKTARLLGNGLTQKDISSGITVSSEANTNIVHVAATSTSPRLAASIANIYTQEFVRGQQEASREYFRSALELVDKQLAALSPQQQVGQAGLALQDRRQSLEILSGIQSGNVQVAKAADEPSVPSSPKLMRNTVVGAIFGLLLGLALAFVRERLDRRIKDPDDLASIFGLPLLATIPQSPAYARHAAVGGEEYPLPRQEAEVFQMLRARLRYFNVNRELRLVLVTSAAPGDGKTTVVQNLAEAAAAIGNSVLIIEADLRQPTMAARSWLRRAPGLAEVLISAAEVSDAVQGAPFVSTTTEAASGGGSVSVLPAGTIPPNPAELIESDVMARILEWASSNYDLVLIDTPPLAVVPDAIPLLRRIDGVVIVNRLGRHTRDGAAQMRDELTRLGAPVLGVVANGVMARDMPAYGYGAYGYSVDEATSQRTREAARS